MTWKIPVNDRQEIARSIWDLFIHNIQKLKVHYGKDHIFIVVKLEDDIDTENVTEANMTNRRDGYSELTNVPMHRDG